VVVPTVLQVPVPDSTKLPDGAGIALITSGTDLRFCTVSNMAALVAPTAVLGNAMAEVIENNDFTPVPLRLMTLGLLAAFDGIVSVPVKSLFIALNPDAVKVTPTVHEVFGASVMPEQVSDEIAKFGPAIAPAGCVRVATLTVPITMLPDACMLLAATIEGAVVLPLTPP